MIRAAQHDPAPAGRFTARPYIRCLEAVLVLCIACGGVYLLSMRLTSQLIRLRGEHLFFAGNFSGAAEYFSEAAARPFRDPDVLRQWGDACFKAAANHSDPTAMRIRARDAFVASATLNPLDARSFFGAAECEALLAQDYKTRHPYAPRTPFDPLPWFETAVTLRPNGISYQYAMARYLAGTSDVARLASTVRRLASIYPPVYFRLTKEKFWSEALASACIAGLNEAIANVTMPREAHTAVSALLAERNLWSDAISHYERALEFKTFQNTPANDFHLGYLYLKNGTSPAAREAFLKGLLRSRERDRDLSRIFGYYRREKDDAGFITFHRAAAAKMTFSPETALLTVQSLLSQQQYDTAREALASLIRERPLPQAYYWLARTAEHQEDWDAMELAAQKATILEENNSAYHALFSRVLYRLKKYDRAEQAAGLAIQYAKKPSAWLYNQRAGIRYQKKDYEGALSDWRAALALKPDYEPFKKRIGEMEGKRDKEKKFID